MNNYNSIKKHRELYQYRIMEPVECELDTSLNNPQKYNDCCEIIAETIDYSFYVYKAYYDHSGGYVIRRSKKNPNETLFFGNSYQLSCIYDSYLVQCNHSGERGDFFINIKNINTGKSTDFDWLGKGDRYINATGYGRIYVQDTIEDVSVIDDELVFHITRRKSNYHIKQDIHDIDMKYILKVTIDNEQFRTSYSYDTEKKETKDLESSTTNKMSLSKEWPLTCSYSANLWLLNEEAIVKQCGFHGNASELRNNEFFTPALIIRNENDYDLSGFKVEYTIDGIEHGFWNVDSLGKKGFKQLWITRKIPQIANSFGIHRIEYYILDYLVYSFTWQIENQKYNWISSLSASASLKAFVGKKAVRSAGLLGVLSALKQGEFYCPNLCITNNLDIATPIFDIQAVVDKKQNVASWRNISLDARQMRCFSFTESLAQQYMSTGQHSIVFHINGQVICRLQWEIKQDT